MKLHAFIGRYMRYRYLALSNITLAMFYPSISFAVTVLESTDKGWVLDSDTEYCIKAGADISSGGREAAIFIPGNSGYLDPAFVLFQPPGTKPASLPAITLINSGNINNYDNINHLVGVAFFNNGTLNNMQGGKIDGAEHAVIAANGTHDIFNEDTIRSSAGNAITLVNSKATIVNTGMIGGMTRAVDALAAGGDAMVNTGIIASHAKEAIALAADNTLVNAGIIDSDQDTAILLNGANNHLFLETGSEIYAKTGIAVLSNGAGNTLTLSGMGEEYNSFIATAPENGLTKVTVSQGSQWRLDGGIQAFGSAADVLDVAGSLTLGGAVDIVGGGGTIQKTGELWLANNGSITGSLLNQGRMAFEDSSTPAAFTLRGNLINDGDIQLSPQNRVGRNTLVVDGDYVGKAGSTLRINGALGDDASPVDNITISGNASGETQVVVSNVGGIGGKTLQGIELITVKGRSSEGAFVQKGRIVVGSYDYFLQKGRNEQPQENSWYLSSALPNRPPALFYATQQPAGQEPGEQPLRAPVGLAASPAEAVPVPPVAPALPKVLRPEAGAYAVNNAVANTLFITQLADRLPGSTRSSLWLRQSGTEQRSQAGGQLDNKSHQYVTQLGGDLVRLNAGERGAVHLGAMAGYGRSSGKSTSQLTGYGAKQSLSGYSGGISLTWYSDEMQRTGFYSDSWLLYSAFDNHVKGEALAGESYHSQGWTASSELGYVMKSALTPTQTLSVQPQVQAVWMGVEANKHREANGSLVQSAGKGGVMTRTGLRMTLESASVSPYVELNWVHTSRPNGIAMDGVVTEIAGSQDVVEIKPGVSARLTADLEITAQATVQKGQQGYQNVGGTLGIHYAF